MNSAIILLNFISSIFSRYILLILLLFGTIGLTFNTLIFTRRTFRTNSCIHYFLASTITNYFVIYFILPSRILSDGYNIDPGRYHLFYCKLRFYVYYTAKSLSLWFIVLACFDRQMSSSKTVRYRAFSQLKISRWMIIITVLLGLSLYAHILIFYEIDSSRTCQARAGFYRVFNDVFYLIAYSLAPPLLMVIFGLQTLTNIRRLRRVGPQMSRQMGRLNQRDHTLILMLVLQISFVTLTAVPHAVQKLYTTLTAEANKDELMKASENLFVIVARTISFINHSCSFYVLTFSGKIFRQEWKKIMKIGFCRNQIQQGRIITRRMEFNANTQQLTVHLRRNRI